ncbi:DUF4003 family protein [Lysinibacillus odysseyi]|uniref:DUF4003 domain-containing protein n=1 Tax=Lysinibacillus odysseyi 34hs-1 = NBRC 100172 TaxID=1220589 RepID=A0A0A3JID5_9BACI|nr:DUF4003 family protein [Lysinibacillus odysseyi]KGR86747.1 hypothetical protein CD32_05255 [Lysinibacillus odysseyi 34hs-1 = NBRC 100172]
MPAQFIQMLEKNYTKVFNYTGGHPDLRTVVSLAAQYTYANRTYSGVEHQAVMDKMTSGKGPFHVFRPCSRNIGLLYKVAASLLLDGNIEESALQVEKKDSLLDEHRFGQSSYRVISSFFLKDKKHAGRAKKLYDKMSKHHPILTRKSDFPLAVIVTAPEDSDIDLYAQTMHDYFDALHMLGFKAGDSLQTLTQILTLYDAHFQQEFAEYVAQLKIELEKKGIHIKRIHYPFLGILALSAADTQVIVKVVMLEEQLRNSKALKGVKELALIIAIQKFVREYGGLHQVIDTQRFTGWQGILELGDLFFYLPVGATEGLAGLLDIDVNF